MSININLKIQKKDLWLLSAIVVFLVGVGYVIAYDWATGSGTGLPSIHGHTINEIEGAVVGSGGCSFGDWVDMGTSESVNGPATSDGFVLAYGDKRNIIGYTDNSSNPATVRTEDAAGQFVVGFWSNLMMPVKKGDYWKVERSAADGILYKIWWIPLNCGGSGGGGNCQWLELPQVECDGSGKCRGKISLEEAENNGYTGSCYFQKENSDEYWGGEMIKNTATTSKSTSMLICKRINEQGTEDRNLDATHKAYYYTCTGGGGTLQCVQKNLTGGNFNGQTLSCDAGYTITGGGCVWRSDGNDQYVYSYPNGNGWYCRDDDFPAVSQIWAICCKVE